MKVQANTQGQTGGAGQEKITRSYSSFTVCRRLIGLVRPLTGYMLLAVLMGIIGQLCAIFITVGGGMALLNAMGLWSVLPFSVILGLMGTAALLRGLLRYGEQACNHFIAFKLLALIRDKVFGALRRLTPAKLEGRDKGNLISVITSDIELLEVFYAHTISPVLIAAGVCVIMCLLIGSIHPILGVLALAAYVTVGVIIPVAASRAGGDDGMILRTRSGELSSFLLDNLRGLKECIQYGTGYRRMEELNERSKNLSAKEERMKDQAAVNMASTNTVIWLFALFMLAASLYFYTRGELDFGGGLLAVLGMMSSFGPVVALANLGSTLLNTFAAGNRVLAILDEKPVTEDITGQEKSYGGGIQAEKVNFSYETEKILSDLSLTVEKDKITGIVGKSGSGKSTLLKLFMRFWDVDSGQIRINEKEIRRINTGDLRNMEGFVTQETSLFHDSIENNLRIAKPDATVEELTQACRKASVHDFIMSLPEGYQSQVGELGDTLSGGERQRLGLARAFLHDAPLLFLDEPTSNLDSLNEAVILKALHEQRKEKTVVLVSHRLSTMGIADKVYTVENGRKS